MTISLGSLPIRQASLDYPSWQLDLHIDKLFRCRKVVNNACATIAVLNGVCNIPSVQMGSELQELLSFAAGMDAQVRR